MGFLLKEVLKTLCGSNQWSYAVFWKIGCQNPNLLIWEECHYEPMPCSVPRFGLPFGEWEGSWASPKLQSSQLETLINKMMMDNQINVLGEGIVGRSAFTGKHEWILSSNYSRHAHPPEVSNQLQNQFSSGMQTVAIVPVLPHGVVQLGSPLALPENVGFLNDVKSLILQLGCVPGALLFDHYPAKLPTEEIRAPVTFGMPVSVNSSGFDHCFDISQSSGHVGQSSYPLKPQVQDNALTFQNPSLVQNGVVGADVIPMNLDAWSNQRASSENLRFNSNHQRGNPRLIEQNFSGAGLQGYGIGDICVPNPHKSTDVNLCREEKTKPGFRNVEPMMIQHIPGLDRDCQKQESGSRSSIPKYEDAVCVVQPSSGDDLFDMVGLNYKNKILNGDSNGLFANTFKDASFFTNTHDAGSEISESGLFSGMGSDHLLDAVVSRAQSFAKQSSDDNVSSGTAVTKISSSSVRSDHTFSLPSSLLKSRAVGSSSFKSGYGKDDDPGRSCSQSSSIYGSQISSWVEQGQNLKHDTSISTAFSKKPDDCTSKPNRKRLKPGENPRPRPKDRQMIQDRVKELREIVPNGAKCSIDALLERTIKHMFFLQSVTKHADKLKQTGESKIVNKEGGLLLKDNYEGGATWAFEVGSKSMVCPIIVEDLNSPRQMLVEMLCEERGFFLEIADLIRGMGLTILKGVMEARNDKIWARFVVEANRDVTRMEIFMSLVRLLEQTVKGSVESNNMIAHHSFPQQVMCNEP